MKYAQNVLTDSVVSGGLNFSALLFQWAPTYVYTALEWLRQAENDLSSKKISNFLLYVTLNKQKTILQSDLIFMWVL